MSEKHVNRWWSRNVVPNKFQPAPPPSSRPPFLVHQPCDNIGADLADMRRLKRFNNGYSWILVCVDLFSRKIIGAVPMKTKTATETATALTLVLETSAKNNSNCIYQIFTTDNGTEFLGQCKQVYAKYHLKHVNTQDTDIKVSLAERKISEIKRKLWKEMSWKKTWKWIDLIDDIVSSLNDTFNRNLKDTPNRVANDQDYFKIWRSTIGPKEDEAFQKASNASRKNLTYKFKIDDIVRLRLPSTKAFHKKYESSWTTDLFVITDRLTIAFKPRYLVRELISFQPVDGSFAQSDLMKFSIPKFDIHKHSPLEIVDKRYDSENLLQIRLKKTDKWEYYDNVLKRIVAAQK